MVAEGLKLFYNKLFKQLKVANWQVVSQTLSHKYNNFICHLNVVISIVSDLSWTRWYLDSDLSRTWSLDSPNVQVGLDRVQQYMLFFLFQNKTINLARLFLLNTLLMPVRILLSLSFQVNCLSITYNDTFSAINMGL